jgi:hypothetical protein
MSGDKAPTMARPIPLNPHSLPPVSPFLRLLPRWSGDRATGLLSPTAHLPRTLCRSFVWLARLPLTLWSWLGSLLRAGRWALSCAVILLVLYVLVGSSMKVRPGAPIVVLDVTPGRSPLVSLPATGPTRTSTRAPALRLASRWVAVTHTGGVGLHLRPYAGLGTSLATLPESTELRAIGPPVQREGRLWQGVRDPLGRNGWVAAAYLTVAAPPEHLRVGQTGGRGVYLRRTPSRALHIRAWPDRTPLVAFGALRSAGQQWVYVRDPAGHLGWVPARYLVPAR